MKVSVITLTYRRPLDLAQALPVLLEHVEAVAGAELVVVDNDTEPSAQAVVQEWSADHPVRYVHEPRPGIAAARNRGLDETAGSDVVVFIDDDERPSDGWLPALLATYERYRPTGVAGRVVSAFDGPVDPWIVAGRFFERLRHETGTVVPVVATNNLLLDVRSVQDWGLRFDEEFGLSGGSDTVFALEVVRRGGTFVWCDEAAVVDVVPPSRLTRRWVLRRAFRSGNSGSRAALHVLRSGRGPVRARMAARGTVRVAGGLARLAVGAVTRDVGRQAHGARTLARGGGMVLGAFGYVYSEYSRRPSAVSTAPPGTPA
ncbi:MAG TPA: glycosyltransferase family 2 protein [Actinotalea sp.]